MVKSPPAIAGDTKDGVLSLGQRRSPGEGHGNPLQYSCLENSMDRGVHRVRRELNKIKRVFVGGFFIFR